MAQDDALARLLRPQQNPNEINANPTPAQAAGSQLNPIDNAPIPGEGVPGVSQAGQGNIITPEQKAELQQMLALVQGQNSKLVSNQLSSRNDLSSSVDDLMAELFQVLIDAGVDPSNPASVRAFMEQLAERDPDLLEIFEGAFMGLLQNNPDSAAFAAQQPDQRPQADIANNNFDSPVTERFRNLSRMGGPSGDGQLGPPNPFGG